MIQQQILTNKYIPPKSKETYEWYEFDLMTYISDLKYEQFEDNTDSYFSLAKVINFDMIHKQSRKIPLKNLTEHYKAIFSKDFCNDDDSVYDMALPSAIRSQRDNVRIVFNTNLKLHINKTVDINKMVHISKDLESNGKNFKN